MSTQERIAYPIEEGFDLIGVSRTRGYQAMATGELKTFKIGRRRMASRQALEEYVAAAEAKSRKQVAA